MKDKKKILVKNIALRNKILSIMNSTEMWTYLMDSYHFSEEKDRKKLLQKDFDEMVDKIIQCVIEYYEKQ